MVENTGNPSADEWANAQAERMAMDQRISDLEQRLAEAEANLQAQEQANHALKAELAGRRREDEEKFRDAFEQSAIGFAMTTPDGRFVDANRAYCALTGYGIQELHDFAYNQLVHPEDIAENLRLNRQMDTGQINGFILENRYVRKDGQTVWVRKSISRVHGADGEPRWNIALVEDITERKQAEAALQAAGQALNERNLALEQAHIALINERNRLLAVMEALPVGVSILNEKGGQVQANRAFDNLWGAPRPGVSGIDDYQAYQAWWVESGRPVQPEEWASARAVQSGETVTGQYFRIQKFDGSAAYVLNSGAPIRDAQGQVVGATVAILDITQRVLAEQSLRVSEERFRVALAALPMTVFMQDPELRYTWVYHPRMGLNEGDILGKLDEDIFPPETAAELRAIKQPVIERCESVQKEIEVLYKGERQYYLLSLEPLCNAYGQVTGLIGASQEITEQKRVEMERVNALTRAEVQRQLLENRERERQEIARDLHDGPIQLLAGTIFHLQAARETEQDPLLKIELEQATLNLKGAVRELRDMMNELRPPAIIRFGLAKSARMYVENFRDKHPEIQIHLHMFDDGDLLPEPIRLALFRIFQESLNNIVKHANASKVWIRLMKKDGAVQLQIRDNGAGFSVPADLIWQTQRGHYGLAGMKERAEAVGGTLTVTSEAGVGTTCLVVVPVG